MENFSLHVYKSLRVGLADASVVAFMKQLNLHVVLLWHILFIVPTAMI